MSREAAKCTALLADLRLLQELQAATPADVPPDPVLLRTIDRIKRFLRANGIMLAALLVALLVVGCRTQLEQLDQVAHQVDAGEQLLDQLPAGPPDLLDPLCYPVLTPACPNPFPDGGRP